MSLLQSALSNTKYILTVFLLCIFITVAYFGYSTYVKPILNNSYVENKEYISKENISNDEYAELIFFHTTWCPHSQTAMKEWLKFKEKMNNVTINNYTLIFKEVDCEEDEKMADDFHIEGYPTIKLVKNADEIIEFDATPTLETLEEFVNTTL